MFFLGMSLGCETKSDCSFTFSSLFVGSSSRQLDVATRVRRRTRAALVEELHYWPLLRLVWYWDNEQNRVSYWPTVTGTILVQRPKSSVLSE